GWSMPQGNLHKWAPLTGALSVILTVASFGIGGEPPDSDDSAAEVVEYFSDHDTQTVVAALVASLGAVALVFFGASLVRILQDRQQRILPWVALGGAIVGATGIATDSAFRFALAESADEVDPVAVQSLNALWANFFFPMVVGLGALILAVSIAGLLTRVVPLWLAWIGILIFVVFFTPAGFVAFFVGGAWIIVVSILFWRRESAADTGIGTAPATTVP
ncbi:MAG: hypothetical protein ACRDWD_12740, partial [Acidimicrobiia bacterium]